MASTWTQKSFSNFSSFSWDFKPRKTRLPPPNMVVMNPSLTVERECALVENSIEKSFGSPRILTVTWPIMPAPYCGFAEILYSGADPSFVTLKPLSLKKFSTCSLKSGKLTFFPTQRSCIFETSKHRNLLLESPLNVLLQGTVMQAKGNVAKLKRPKLLKLNWQNEKTYICICI